jgi:hypothetical protein
MLSERARTMLPDGLLGVNRDRTGRMKTAQDYRIPMVTET